VSLLGRNLLYLYLYFVRVKFYICSTFKTNRVVPYNVHIKRDKANTEINTLHPIQSK